jgi:hypothetical protein
VGDGKRADVEELATDGDRGAGKRADVTRDGGGVERDRVDSGILSGCGCPGVTHRTMRTGPGEPARLSWPIAGCEGTVKLAPRFAGRIILCT